MNTLIDVQRFMDLFCHRRDVFAEQHANGSYTPVKREITPEDIADHLAGHWSIGCYVIKPGENTVRSVVWDLDTTDEKAFTHLVNCVRNIPRMTGRAMLVEWSGGKGWHVHAFFASPVPARDVRYWVETEFRPAWQELAIPNRWPLEVFPKQDEVEEDGYGNLVKLPLGRHAKSGGWSQFEQGLAVSTSVSEVVGIEPSVVPEAPVVATSYKRVPGVSGAAVTPFPCVDRILEGDVDLGTRNVALFHLALYFYGHGIEEDLAIEQCLRTNERFAEPLPDHEVRSAIRHAYTGRQKGAACGTDWLRDFCPGPCHNRWTVGRVDLGNLRRLDVGDVVNLEVTDVQKAGPRMRLRVRHPDAQNEPTLIF